MLPIFYRYTWLNPEYETSIENIFRQNRIFTPLIKDLNDPFDCIPQLDLANVSDAEIINDMIRKFRNDGLAESEINDNVKYIKAASPKKYLTYNFFNVLIPNFKKSRVLSLSTTNVDFAMWVNYAHFFEGFVLELKFDDSWKDVIFPVIYKEQLYKFDPREIFDPKFDTKVFVESKASHWVHEEEWRIYNHYRTEADNIELPDKAILSISLGMKMSEQDKDKIIGWVKEYQPSIKVRNQILDTRGNVFFKDIA